MADRDSNGRFVKGNSAGLVHGGGAAVQNLQHGRPFHGLAALEEAAVSADLELHGRAALVRQQAIRLTAAANLFWGAICKLADCVEDDKALKRLEGLSARYAWLAAAALRAWAQVRQEEKDAPAFLDYDTLAQELKGNG